MTKRAWERELARKLQEENSGPFAYTRCLREIRKRLAAGKPPDIPTHVCRYGPGCAVCGGCPPWWGTPGCTPCTCSKEQREAGASKCDHARCRCCGRCAELPSDQGRNCTPCPCDEGEGECGWCDGQRPCECCDRNKPRPDRWADYDYWGEGRQW